MAEITPLRARRGLWGLVADRFGFQLSVAGEPIPGAQVDVWQADKDGFYDVRYQGLDQPTTGRSATCSRPPTAARCARRTCTSWCRRRATRP
jgi:hypothetical protein